MKSLELIVKRVINAPCNKVFEAWSKPEIMEKWFYPPQMDWEAIATNDFRVGGQYRLEMKSNDGNTYVHTGEYKEIIPNNKIVFTWNSHVVTHTLVTVELREIENNRTDITLTHTLFPSEELLTRHQIGWNGCLDNMNHFFQDRVSTAYSFHCNVRYRSPLQKVYQAITSENGLKGWWTTDCTVNTMSVGSKSIFRFGKTYNMMKTGELVPNQKIVWECLQQHMAEPGLAQTEKGEWVGTKLIFQLVGTSSGETDLFFTHEGLTNELSCFNHCQNRWNYYFKESLKEYLETGVGKPYQ